MSLFVKLDSSEKFQDPRNRSQTDIIKGNNQKSNNKKGNNLRKKIPEVSEKYVIGFENVFYCVFHILRKQRQLKQRIMNRTLTKGTRFQNEMQQVQEDPEYYIDVSDIYQSRISEFPDDDPNYPLIVVERLNMDSIKFEVNLINDDWPFLKLRRKLALYIRTFGLACRLASTSIFIRIVSYIMILLYCVLLHNEIHEINDSNQSVKNGIYFFFIAENTMELISRGFLLTTNPYFTNFWCLLDFSVLFLKFTSETLFQVKLDFFPLRLFRILKILKIAALQNMLKGLSSSSKQLSETLFIVIFFIIVFSNIGLHAFSGSLQLKCFDSTTGKPQLIERNYCGNMDCFPDQNICGRLIVNYNSPTEGTFDDFFSSMFIVLRIFTVNNWTDILYATQKTASNYSSLYFITVMLTSNYILLNLILAVLKVKYSDTLNKIAKEGNSKSKKTYKLRELRELNIPFGRNLRKALEKREKVRKAIPRVAKFTAGRLRNTLQKLSFESAESPSHHNFKNTMDFNFLVRRFKDVFVNKRFEQIKSTHFQVKVLSKAADKNKNIEDVLNTNEENNNFLFKIQEQKRFQRLNVRKDYTITLLHKVQKMYPHLKEFLGYGPDKRKIWFMKDIYKRTHKKEKKKTRNNLIKIPVMKPKRELLRTLSYIQGNYSPSRKLKSKATSNILLANNIRKILNEGKSEKSEVQKKDPMIALFEKHRGLRTGKLDNIDEYLKILEIDRIEKKMNLKIWSGNAVIPALGIRKLRSMLRDLNRKATNFKGYTEMVVNWRKYILKPLFLSDTYHQISISLVSLNILVLSLEGLINDDDLNFSLIGFNVYFTFEMVALIASFGIKKHLKSQRNQFEMAILFYSYMELFMGNKIRERFPSFRLFEVVIVFRIWRVFQYLEIANFIYFIIRKTFSSFISIAVLLLLFTLVFAMMGQQFFKITFTDDRLRLFQKDYTLFSTAFITVFQIITLDDWFSVYEFSIKSGLNPAFLYIYLTALMIFGNFILLNLFIANMLNGFECLSTFDMEILKNDDNNDETSNTLGTYLTSYNTEGTFKATILFKKKKSSTGTSSTPQGRYPAVAYTSIGERRSVYIFTKSNIFRKYIFNIVTHIYFHWAAVIFAIITNIRLGLDGFFDALEDQDKFKDYHIFSDVLYYLCNLFFLVEFIFKTITYGFVQHKRAYMRNFFNVLEFICIVSFLGETVFKLESLKAVGMLRMLRLIKIFFKSVNSKVIFKSFFNSFEHIFRILFLILVVWLLFGIVGIEMFRDRFGFCRNPMNFKINRCECDSWKNSVNNFDNILESLFTLLTVSTFDGWGEIMARAVNSDLESKGPSEFNNQWSSYIFFISFIFIGTYFFLNFFLGIIFSYFTLANKNLKTHAFLTEDQIRWTEIQKLIINTEPLTITVPKNKLQKYLSSLINHRNSQNLIILVLIGDIIRQTLYKNDMTYKMQTAWNSLDIFFFLVYLLEVCIKIFALGLKGFFFYKRHSLELFVVFSYIIHIILDSYFDDIDNKEGRRAIRVFAVFRLLSSIRIILMIKSLRNFLINTSFALPFLLNMFSIICLTFFMYSVMGCYLFGQVKKGKVIDEYANFSNLLYAMMTLFRCSTAEDWVDIMHDVGKVERCVNGVDCGSSWAPGFFISFMLITNLILLNLFTLIILQQFEGFFISALNPVQIMTNINEFKYAWSQFPHKISDKMISFNKIIQFMKFLGPPLGCSKSQTFFEVGKNILNMRVFCNSKGQTLFSQLLYSTLRNYYYPLVFDVENVETKRALRLYENLFYKNLAKKEFVGRKRGEEMISNPLYIYMLSYMSFLTWRKFARLYPRNHRGKIISNDLNKIWRERGIKTKGPNKLNLKEIPIITVLPHGSTYENNKPSPLSVSQKQDFTMADKTQTPFFKELETIRTLKYNKQNLIRNLSVGKNKSEDILIVEDKKVSPFQIDHYEEEFNLPSYIPKHN